MRLRIDWQDLNYGESEYRLYRSTAPMDPQALPAPIATIPAPANSYADATVVDKTRYFYILGVVVNGAEYLTPEVEIIADETLALETGYWLMNYAGWGSVNNEPFDPSATGEETWAEDFALTVNTVLIDNYKYQAAGPVDTGSVSGVINRSPVGCRFYLLGTNGTWTYTRCDFDLELLDSSDNVVAVFRMQRDGSYQHGLWYGPDFSNLTKTPKTGADPKTSGWLEFDLNGFGYEPDTSVYGSEYNNAFRYDVDLSSVVKMNFPYIRAYMDYSGGNGHRTYSYLKLIDNSAPVYGLATSPAPVSSEVALSWQEGAPDAILAVNVYRDTVPLDTDNLPAPVGTLTAGGVQTFTDTVPDPTVNYYYAVTVDQEFKTYPSAVVEAVFTPLKKDLLAYYTMSGVTGSNLPDDSGNGYAGTLYGGATVVTALDGDAIAVDGLTGYVDTGLDAELDNLYAASGNTWGIACDFIVDGLTGSDMAILGRGGGTGTSATFAVFVSDQTNSQGSSAPTGNLVVDIRGVYTDTGVNVSDGEEHTVSVDWDGSNGYVDIDGLLLPLNIGTSSLQTGYTLCIGQSSADNSYFKGKVDRVRAYSAAFTHDKRQQVARELLGFYDFAVAADPDTLEATLGWKEIDPLDVAQVVVYRDTSPIDPASLPAPLATVGAGVGTYLDTVPAQSSYYYLIDVQSSTRGSRYSDNALAVFDEVPAQLSALAASTWFDISETSLLFQDTVGTTPATADGDPVQRIEDKSGDGNHAVLTNGTATLRTDGVRWWLDCSGITFTFPQMISGTQDRTVAYVARPTGLSTLTRVDILDLIEGSGVTSGEDWCITLEDDGVNAGSWVRVNGNKQFNMSPLPTQDYSILWEWGLSLGANVTDTKCYNSNTLLSQVSAAGATINTKVNTNSLLGYSNNQGSSNRFTGRLYQVFLLRALLSAQQRSDLDVFMRGKAGL